MAHHHFFLHYGKHEDQSLAHLDVRHQEGFDTVLDAMLDFRRVLTEYIRGIRARRVNDCCVRSEKAGHNYCPTCGADLRGMDDEERADLLANTYMSLFWDTGTMDSCAKLMRLFEAEGWELSYWGVPVDPVVVTNVDRWLEEWWDDDSPMPYMEARFPDGTTWSTYDDR